MTYQEFLSKLPINNFHRFDSYEDWSDFYSTFYPTENEQEEIYRNDYLHP